MLEAARLIHGYMAGVSFDQFWHNSEKRDAVALRISVLGESAGLAPAMRLQFQPLRRRVCSVGCRSPEEFTTGGGLPSLG